MRLTSLHWLVFLYGIWMEMFMKNPTMAPPPLTIWDQTKVEVPFHPDDMSIKEAV